MQPAKPPYFSNDGYEQNGCRPVVMAFGRDLTIVVFQMLVLSGILTLLTGSEFMFQLRYSLAIGISVLVATYLLTLASGACTPNWKIAVVAILIGTTTGIIAGSIANDLNPLSLLENRQFLITMLLVSIACGTAISYFFYSHGAIAATTAALRQEELERISYQQRLTEANFKVLQAQIEPHFLFNTLSNIISLIRTQPDKAEQMLGNFTEYLRAALHQTRSGSIALHAELATIRAYLDIMQVRMEKRLMYQITIQPDVEDVMLPPLLIQPLVENAIVHGIEPCPEGGIITVTAGIEGGMLILVVSDTGVGISTSGSAGVGMANIRERLHSFYHGEALFQVKPVLPHGTTVRLAIPISAGDLNA